jgi:hypothetical protein
VAENRDDSAGIDHSARGDRSAAISAVRAARNELSALPRSEALPKILAGLDQAERELVAPSECRLAKPYAPIIQVGDANGLHYECTHSPPHDFYV